MKTKGFLYGWKRVRAKLKPCPFCGGLAILLKKEWVMDVFAASCAGILPDGVVPSREITMWRAYYVACEHYWKSSDNKAKAIAAWNRRSAEVRKLRLT